MTVSDESEQGREALRVTDRRRIDPTTGQVRGSQSAATPGAPGSGAPESPGAADVPSDEDRTAVQGQGQGTASEDDESAAPVEAELAELTADLQRLQAEYANYRRRVERDREAVRLAAVAGALVELLPVLDDVGRAREHGELEGGFKAVGEALEATLARLGLESYAEPGEPFDPTLHEALTAVPSVDVEEPTVQSVYQPGYRFAGRIVRPARVVVAQPEAVAPEGGEQL